MRENRPDDIGMRDKRAVTVTQRRERLLDRQDRATLHLAQRFAPQGSCLVRLGVPIPFRRIIGQIAPEAVQPGADPDLAEAGSRDDSCLQLFAEHLRGLPCAENRAAVDSRDLGPAKQ